MTKTLYFEASNKGHLELAAKMLREGKLVAFPTETVYGLGALALKEECVARIFEAKRRPSNNPLIVHVHDIEAARALFDFKGSAFSSHLEERFALLSTQFWPGPLTLVAKKAAHISDAITGGHSKVAVRIPSHPVALNLLRLVGEPVVAPSANLFTRPSPTSCKHVLASLDGRIDAVIDAGITEYGIESTVIDIDSERATILRAGAIPFDDLRKHLPDLRVSSLTNHASPGQCVKHYAPQVSTVTLADTKTLAQAWYSSSGIILRASTESGLCARLGKRPQGAGALKILPNDPKGIASELFSAFYEMEGAGLETLLIEDLMVLKGTGDWDAVCDRLARATSHDQAASFGAS